MRQMKCLPASSAFSLVSAHTAQIMKPRLSGVTSRPASLAP